MIPLSVTIAFIYGMLGFTGRDYDMPVAVLSSLTLGMSIDFAIHYIERARELVKETGSWAAASREMEKHLQECAVCRAELALIRDQLSVPLGEETERSAQRAASSAG